MVDRLKGTVTPLASVFPAEEAKKAAQRVEDAIAQRQKELDHLRQFISDNTAIINLVQKLPDEISHEIMVPFGRAAFFPGRLIHTNELLVLLGDGHYAERTAKQTIEILQRRGKALEGQSDSLKAMISDLHTEASFFSNTAAEADEGLVEIREEYVEDHSAETIPRSGRSPASGVKESEEDAEYAQMMSRLDELEKEEEAALESDEDEEDALRFISPAQVLKANTVVKETDSESNLEKSSTTERHLPLQSEQKVSAVHPQKTNEKIPTVSKLNIEDPDDDIEHHNSTIHKSQIIIGSVVEHSHGLPSDPTRESSSSAGTSKPSKPVSRFKMQRGYR
ncbi:uncharacterized protein [Aristolochia californica]|uniref:uncharacterized protein isoform X2 n=1 Tax=Aristolochia californica TaxID=171875 RepID=UPI0035D86AE4